MKRRAWFAIRVGIKTSRLAHLLATEWTERRDGEAETLCGVRPFDLSDDVGFVEPQDATLCGDCGIERALEEAADVAQPEVAA